MILAYFEDGPNIITMAMNGWAAPEPAWWLNLQANPEAVVQLPDRQVSVHARSAKGDERERLWGLWREVGDSVDEYAKRRPEETAVVVLEPIPSQAR
ncbi:hypothetical protein GORHZ_060_00480 [Gordonia rhizosphera NBRC 16068]|uniref:Nitroreductase family deazaflavin-dependent oxidoreductase n=1 Tax=Gordonia rhizosphera NBRC 16068 TaxID=1108045 RepID=K6W6S2_9ACTN|nr:hypothetical protein GORHZ_060_00480 [Gordonia rhizosphera NBRC 16068]